MNSVDPNVVLAGVFALIGALGAQIVAAVAGWFRSRSERQHQEWLSWRRNRLDSAADALGELHVAASRVSSCGVPTPRFDTKLKSELHEAFDSADKEMDKAEARAHAMAASILDDDVDAALLGIMQATFKLSMCFLPPSKFMDGVESFDRRPVVGACTDLEAAIQAALMRIDELAAGARPKFDPERRADLLAIRRGDYGAFEVSDMRNAAEATPGPEVGAPPQVPPSPQQVAQPASPPAPAVLGAKAHGPESQRTA